MNILFICTARSWGGNEKWSAMAMNGLLKKGHRIVLICRKRHIWNNRISDIPIITMPFFLHFNPLTFIMTYIVIRRFRINRIISTKRTEYVVGGILSRLLKIRHLIRLGIVRAINSRFKERVYGRLNDGIIVNAAKTRDILIKSNSINPQKIRLIYNGVPDPVLQGQIKKNKEKSGVFRIVSTGSLHPRKGFDILISAVASLPDELKKKIELVLIGDGPARSELEKLVRQYKIESQVRFTGFLDNPEKETAQADLFVLMSQNEGISNAVLEAMMQRIPVLTSSAGGHGDFITNDINGFITEPEAESVCDAIKNLMLSHDLQKVGECGRETVLKIFSVERMATQLEEFIIGES